MIISLGVFIGLIAVSIIGAGVLMILLLLSFIREFKKNEIW